MAVDEAGCQDIAGHVRICSTMNDWRLVWTSERSIWAEMSDRQVQSGAPSKLAVWISNQRESGIQGVIPSSRGVLIEFEYHACIATDPWSVVDNLIHTFERERCSSSSIGQSLVREIVIPVCYDEQVAPDLEHIAHRIGCSHEQIIEMHWATEYRVDAMGFMPGFGYLTGLHDSLRVPRKDVPRTRVPAGSVAIADGMTAVYPHQSAGGWHLIGRTPIQLFCPSCEEPAVLRVGDSVRFNRISIDEFHRYDGTQQSGGS